MKISQKEKFLEPILYHAFLITMNAGIIEQKNYCV